MLSRVGYAYSPDSRSLGAGDRYGSAGGVAACSPVAGQICWPMVDVTEPIAIRADTRILGVHMAVDTVVCM